MLQLFDLHGNSMKEKSVLPSFTKEEAEVQARIKDTLVLMEALSTWGDQMLKLDPATLMKVMKLGAKIQNLLLPK